MTMKDKYITYKVQDYKSAFFATMLLGKLCVSWNFTRIWRILSWPHHFYKKGGAHISSLTSPLYIEILVSIQESEWSHICVLGLSTAHDFTVFLLDFGTFLMKWYFFLIVSSQKYWIVGTQMLPEWSLDIFVFLSLIRNL